MKKKEQNYGETITDEKLQDIKEKFIDWDIVGWIDNLLKDDILWFKRQIEKNQRNGYIDNIEEDIKEETQLISEFSDIKNLPEDTRNLLNQLENVKNQVLQINETKEQEIVNNFTAAERINENGNISQEGTNATRGGYNYSNTDRNNNPESKKTTRKQNLNKEDLKIKINVRKNKVETYLGGRREVQRLSDLIQDIKMNYQKDFLEYMKPFKEHGMEDLIPTILEGLDNKYGTSRKENFEDLTDEYYLDFEEDYGKIDIEFNLKKLYKVIKPSVPIMCQGKLLEVAKQYKEMGLANVKMGVLTGTIDKVKTLGKIIKKLPSKLRLEATKTEKIGEPYEKADEEQDIVDGTYKIFGNGKETEPGKPFDSIKIENSDGQIEKEAIKNMGKATSLKPEKDRDEK